MVADLQLFLLMKSPISPFLRTTILLLLIASVLRLEKAAAAISCAQVHTNPLTTRALTLQSGFYLKKTPPVTSRRPIEDYRLYQYPEWMWTVTSPSIVRRKIHELEALTKSESLDPKIRYLRSVYDITTWKGPIAFFKATDGSVFGIPHQKLFQGKDNLTDPEKALKVLESVQEVYLAKKIDPRLDKIIKLTDQYRYKAHNLRTDLITEPMPSHPMFSDPSLKLYELSETKDLLLAHRSFESNGFKIEIMESVGAKIKGMDEGKASGNGDELQQKLLNEVLDFVFRLYAERRGWSQEFIESLRQKAIETVNSTKYVVVRNSDTNEILACIGLSRAPYGKTLFRNETTWKWEERFGSFGTTISQNGLGPLIPKIEALDTPIPILPMEAYLGNILLPRPSVIQMISRDYRYETALFGRATRATAVRPSAVDPLLFESGIIFEPTKFGVERSQKNRKVAHSLVLKELFSAVFDLQYDNELLNKGQYIYTYNDNRGILLYQAMGFQVLKDMPKFQKDGTEWIVLGLSPQSMIEQMKKLTQSEDTTEAFIQELQNHLARVHENRSKN